jgi:hypothetical protein
MDVLLQPSLSLKNAEFYRNKTKYAVDPTCDIYSLVRSGAGDSECEVTIYRYRSAVEQNPAHPRPIYRVKWNFTGLDSLSRSPD